MGMLRSLQLTEGPTSSSCTAPRAPTTSSSPANCECFPSAITSAWWRFTPVATVVSSLTRLSDLVRRLDQRQTGVRADRHARCHRALGRRRSERTTVISNGSARPSSPGEVLSPSRRPAPPSTTTAAAACWTPVSPPVLMPSGCRMGICFGCVASLRRGAVRDLRTGALTTANDGDGVVVQTCVSAAAGDCDIDL